VVVVVVAAAAAAVGLFYFLVSSISEVMFLVNVLDASPAQRQQLNKFAYCK
jgi:hypothetical protein